MRLATGRVATLQGVLRPPSDKSITHRAYMLAAAAEEPSIVRNPLLSEDCSATLDSLCMMGLEVEWPSDHEVRLVPAHAWRTPDDVLDCGNSGTTMRLLSGLIASRPIQATLVGDESLSRRPMKRIIDPLAKMGAQIEGEAAPLIIQGSSELKGIDYESPVASAQVKSCVLFAGLRAQGETFVREPSLSRDHTERMLEALGVEMLRGEGSSVGVRGGSKVASFELDVPGDISSAAFFMVAAALVPDSQLELLDVGVNPTRSGIFEVFEQCGIKVLLENERVELGEPLADLGIRYTEVLQPFHIEGSLVPRLIDEIPILAVLATQCDGTSIIRDASELRVKESDRIELIAEGLRAMGAEVETFMDGLNVSGPVRLRGAEIDSDGDHRIAMAFAIAGLIAEGQTEILQPETVRTSFPAFEQELWRLCVV
jgi:3-phosphoshikimate 1-carboxyvinyltransferase